ncbi:MAG: DUF5658 family protein [Vicinamibacterales bacterium]
MSRRFLISALLAVFAVAPAAAQNSFAQQRILPVDFTAAVANAAVPAALVGAEQLPSLRMPVEGGFRRPTPSTLMLSLYASTALMQALDVHSTLTAFSAGAVEGNPMMKGIAGNKAAFIAMKAGVAASTIFATRALAKKNKVAAIATLLAINSAYAMVVDHNYKVARAGR